MQYIILLLQTLNSNIIENSYDGQDRLDSLNNNSEVEFTPKPEEEKEEVAPVTEEEEIAPVTEEDEEVVAPKPEEEKEEVAPVVEDKKEEVAHVTEEEESTPVTEEEVTPVTEEEVDVAPVTKEDKEEEVSFVTEDKKESNPVTEEEEEESTPVTEEEKEEAAPVTEEEEESTPVTEEEVTPVTEEEDSTSVNEEEDFNSLLEDDFMHISEIEDSNEEDSIPVNLEGLMPEEEIEKENTEANAPVKIEEELKNSLEIFLPKKECLETLIHRMKVIQRYYDEYFNKDLSEGFNDKPIFAFFFLLEKLDENVNPIQADYNTNLLVNKESFINIIDSVKFKDDDENTIFSAIFSSDIDFNNCTCTVGFNDLEDNEISIILPPQQFIKNIEKGEKYLVYVNIGKTEAVKNYTFNLIENDE